MEDLHAFDRYILSQSEPAKSCMLALKEVILGISPEISTAWKYGMPFFCVRKKMFCYLWTDKITGGPYVGFVDGKLIDHPGLIQGKRSRMKIFPINPDVDLPVDELRDLLVKSLAIRTGQTSRGEGYRK